MSASRSVRDDSMIDDDRRGAGGVEACNHIVSPIRVRSLRSVFSHCLRMPSSDAGARMLASPRRWLLARMQFVSPCFAAQAWLAMGESIARLGCDQK